MFVIMGTSGHAKRPSGVIIDFGKQKKEYKFLKKKLHLIQDIA